MPRKWRGVCKLCEACDADDFVCEPNSRTQDCLRHPSHVECAKFFGDHLACRNENKICHSFIAFVS